MKKRTNTGRSGAPYQREDCDSPMRLRFSDPERRRRARSVAPRETSYESICAAERRPPRKAYFELLDHPALITEWTLREERAKI